MLLPDAQAVLGDCTHFSKLTYRFLAFVQLACI
jgi:hypothetical protein